MITQVAHSIGVILANRKETFSLLESGVGSMSSLIIFHQSLYRYLAAMHLYPTITFGELLSNPLPFSPDWLIIHSNNQSRIMFRGEIKKDLEKVSRIEVLESFLSIITEEPLSK